MPLSLDIQDEILSDIETIDNDPDLYTEKKFNTRVQAIDFVEFHIIDRINALLESGIRSDYLQDLKQHAEKLMRRLEDLNTGMFNGLRSKIAAGTFRGKVLMDMIAEYLDGQLNPYTTQHDIGYDNLDLFINGILSFRKLPAETRNREPEMVYYQKTPARIILEIIKRAEINPQDVFVDLGSGLGQAVMLVHLLTGVKARGVEIELAYCEYARSCAAELNVHNVEFINADARDADYSSGTVFFMYSPFEGKMLQDVLNKLRIEAKNRDIKLITYGPCTQVVAQQPWLFSSYKVHNGSTAFNTFVRA
jgi:hypothetical protein